MTCWATEGRIHSSLNVSDSTHLSIQRSPRHHCVWFLLWHVRVQCVFPTGGILSRFVSEIVAFKKQAVIKERVVWANELMQSFPVLMSRVRKPHITHHSWPGNHHTRYFENIQVASDEKNINQGNEFFREKKLYFWKCGWMCNGQRSCGVLCHICNLKLDFQ